MSALFTHTRFLFWFVCCAHSTFDVRRGLVYEARLLTVACHPNTSALSRRVCRATAGTEIEPTRVQLELKLVLDDKSAESGGHSEHVEDAYLNTRWLGPHSAPRTWPDMKVGLDLPRFFVSEGPPPAHRQRANRTELFLFFTASTQLHRNYRWQRIARDACIDLFEQLLDLCTHTSCSRYGCNRISISSRNAWLAGTTAEATPDESGNGP